MKKFISKKQINKIFEEETHQANVVNKLYELAVGKSLDFIIKVEGFPECGEEANEYIMLKFREFDRKFHPDVSCGRDWLNRGFSTNKNLDNWEVSINNCKIIEKE